MFAVQHSLGSRERILAAARHLFATQGFHQTPIAELAPAANVSVGQIYRLFKNKNDVIVAIVRDDSEEKLVELESLVAEVKDGKVGPAHAFYRLAYSAIIEKDEALSFEILAEAHRNPLVSDTINGFCMRFRAIVRDLACLANPKLEPSELEGVEEVLLALMFGLGHRGLSLPKLSEEDTADWTACMVMAALGAESEGCRG